MCERKRKLDIVLQSGSDIYALQRRDDDTLGMNGSPPVTESLSLVKNNRSEGGYVCL